MAMKMMTSGATPMKSRTPGLGLRAPELSVIETTMLQKAPQMMTPMTSGTSEMAWRAMEVSVIGMMTPREMLVMMAPGETSEMTSRALGLSLG